MDTDITYSRSKWWEGYIHIADLVAFAKVRNLSTSLQPFVKMACNVKNRNLNEDTKAIVFKVRGTVDSYQVILADDNITMEEVEKEFLEELDCVISNELRNRLKQVL